MCYAGSQDPAKRPSAAELLCRYPLLRRVQKGGLLPDAQLLQVVKQVYPTIADATFAGRTCAAAFMIDAGMDLAATSALKVGQSFEARLGQPMRR